MLHARPQHPDCSVRPIRSILTACSRSLLLLLVFAAPATWACDDWLAKAVAITGAVERKSAAIDWQQLQVEQTVCPGDSVRVGPNSRAALYLRNNSFVRLDENSLLDFPAQQQEDGFLLGLSQGFAHFISRIVNRFEVSTPYVNAVVEGTEFIVSASPAAAGVAVMEGKVKTYNDAGTESITSGQQVQATSRTASLTRINVPSASRVEWAIHYPPVLTLQNIQPVSAEEKARLDALTPFLQQNRPDLALQSLEQNPVASPALDLARASLLLAVGRVDEFDALIPALLQGPQAGAAHALKAVADAARNRAEPSLASAHKAVELAPQQAASHIALSYAQQASLQLDDALASAQKATDVEPANALAWLRLVELRLTQGDISAAQKALAQIDKLPPEQQQPQVAILSAKGFVNLFSLKLKAARDNFQAALKQDSADPQNHLGLGLALLRDGKLEDGRRQLEYAVSLDPLRSTLRSYLGRAYFEEKRDGEAIKQWDLAKQFDPNDPTPYFYTGVHKLFANDPIGAVDELEKSKELNDKRDIYRSETLLQSDAASRSATLARAYDEVGYDQGVLLNGWDAIRRDPTNSEGHRLLADKYAGDPRYETARVSELLQSQLWQPLSAYPLQPQLAESDLSVVAGSGPQRPSFNEYHSLFTQDGMYGMANGYGGSDGTWGDDLVGSFLAGPLAVSLGQYHYESNGWRENADQEQDIYSGFMQIQLLPGTSIQLEARNMQWERGDLDIHLLGQSSQNFREVSERQTYRFGLRQDFNPRNSLLFSYVAQKLTEEESEFVDEEGLSAKQDVSPEMEEVQYVSRWDSGHGIFGAGHYSAEVETVITQAFMGIVEEFDLDGEAREFNNAYSYLHIPLGANWTIDPALGYNETRLGEEKESQWSPKLGVSWMPKKDLMLRAAAFKTYQRDLAGNTTLEPSLIAGFNQFFNDSDGYISHSYAFATDAKIQADQWVGMTIYQRDLEYRFADGFGSDRQQQWADLYYSYAISSRYMLNAMVRYQEHDFNRSENLVDEIDRVETLSVPLGLDVFLGGGVSFSVEAVYYDQWFRYSLHDFMTDLNYYSDDGSETCVINAGARYLLPGKFGSINLEFMNLTDEDDQVATYNVEGLEFYPARFVQLTLQFSI